MNHIVTGLWSVFAFSLIVVTLSDGFSFINLSRKTERRKSAARLLERFYWRILRFFYLRSKSVFVREKLLIFFTPVFLGSLMFFSLVALIVGFAILSWSVGEEVRGVEHAATFLDYLYLSGVTFFTLGYGDISPLGAFGKIYSILEVFCGYSFLGLMIGFTSTFNTIYFDRELGLMRIHSRTGFSFSAAAVVYRAIPERDVHYTHEFFRDTQEWVLKLFLSQLCYPIMCYHRSPARRGTWLSGMAILMDLAALTMAWVDLDDQRAGRNLLVTATEELKQFCILFDLKPDLNRPHTRISEEEAMRLWNDIKGMGFPLKEVKNPYEQLSHHLNDYSAYLDALAEYLLFRIPSLSLGEADRGGGMAYSTLF
ncbi:MAG: potassium channel family protein [bacterium]